MEYSTRLQDPVEATGGCGADVDNRVRPAWNSWRGLSGVICDKKVLVRLKTNYTNCDQTNFDIMAASVGLFIEQDRKGFTQPR